MFENITKGSWSIDFKKRNKYGVKVRSLRADDIKNSEYHYQKEIVRVYGNNKHEKQNAEFIVFCFNLQQKYDIGLFEEAVSLLELLVSTNALVFNEDCDKINNLLNHIKQNK